MYHDLYKQKWLDLSVQIPACTYMSHESLDQKFLPIVVPKWYIEVVSASNKLYKIIIVENRLSCYAPTTYYVAVLF